MSARRLRGALLLAAALLPACTTIATLSDGETRNKVYSGTIQQIRLECAHGTCLDFPLSLAADTVLLPVTIPWTLANLFAGHGDHPETDSNARRGAPEGAQGGLR